MEAHGEEAEAARGNTAAAASTRAPTGANPPSLGGQWRALSRTMEGTRSRVRRVSSAPSTGQTTREAAIAAMGSVSEG